jgi:hypothetical protein
VCRAYSSIMSKNISRTVGGRPGVLLDHVQEHLADRRSASVRPGERRRAVEPALGDDLGDNRARALHGRTPEHVQVLGLIECAGTPLPVRVGLEVDRIPRRAVLLTGELDHEPVSLDQRHVFDQPAEGHLAGGGGRAEAQLAEALRLPREGPAVALENGQQRVRLRTSGRCQRRAPGFAHAPTLPTPGETTLSA